MKARMVRHPSFHALLQAQDPSRIALEFFVDGAKAQLTYGEFLSRIESFPLPKEQTVGIFGETSLDCVLAFFALAGKRRIVMLSGEENDETLVAQIRSTGVESLLGPEDLVEEFLPYCAPAKEKKENDILFFTSGTTSRCKAVVLSEQSLCSSAYNGGSLLPLEADDSLLCVLPLSHVFGLVCCLLWPLSFGTKVCLGRGLRSIIFDFDAYRPSVATLVPQIAGFLLSKRLLNPELRLVLIGAGDCPDPILAGLKAQGIRVSFGYGLTETSSGVALSLGDNPREMTVCPDYALSIADDGEILLQGSPTFMKGYDQDEEATKATLHDGILYTGDLGTYENDILRLTGRKKEILVFNDGSKLFLPEFEAALAKALGPEEDFAVVQDHHGKPVLVIHSSRNVDSLIEAFNKNYPWSHQISRILYAQSPLPRTQTGKVQRYKISIDGEE